MTRRKAKAEEAPKTVGYTPEQRVEILAHILGEVAGGRSLDKVLREDAGMPGTSTFWRWHMADSDLRDNLARARENGVERLMDECVDIADASANDTITTEDGDRPNTEWINRSRLRIDTRFKYAQMIAPRKYGPKLDLTSQGEKIETDEVTKVTRLAAIVAAINERSGDAPDDAG